MAQFILNGLMAGSGYALTALSFSVIYLPTRVFHFAHGIVLTFGAYFGFLGTSVLKLPVVVAYPFAIAMSCVLGMAMDIGCYRPLRRRGAGHLVPLVASLGIYVVLQNLISLVFSDDTKVLGSARVTEGIAVLGGRVTAIQLWTVVISVACFMIVWAIFRFTRFGRAIRAVATDTELAQVRGIDTNNTIALAFLLGSGLVGLAGILMALDVDMNPTMGLNPLMFGVVAMVVGGVGSMPGVFLGGVLLGLAQHLTIWRFGGQWQDGVVFVILVIFLITRPQGLLGKPSQRVTV